MADGETAPPDGSAEPAEDEEPSQQAPEPPGEQPQEAQAPLPTSTEVLERLLQDPKPLNINAEHQRRLNEALVKQEETKAAQAGDDRSMRKKFAIWIAAAVGFQIAVADAVFVVYGAANAWVIPGSTVSAWLGATVVQVIAVAVVIVRSLFPPAK